MLEFSNPIVKLKAKDFQDGKLQKNGYYLVLFYSDNCGFCHDMAEEWKRFGCLMTFGNIAVYNGTTDQLPQIKGKKIEGYPSILAFQNGKFIDEHEGERNVASFLEFAMKSIN